MSEPLTTDRAIVEALVAGDVSALADTYDRYADVLFTYARGMLGSQDAAADAVHDSLLIATQRISQLRDPEKFRPWLYAIVRSECLRHLRQGKRTVHLPDDVDFLSPGDEPEEDLHQREMCSLVAAAAEGLSPKDREVLELSIRHDLDNAQVAAVLGISANQASTVTSRARDQLERSLAVLLVAQDPESSCAELASMTAEWDGAFTPLWRKRIGRHMDKCATCSATKDRRFRAEAILVVLPLFLAPIALRDRVRRHDDVQLVSLATPLASRIDPLDSEGFPTQPGTARRRAPVWFAAAALLLVIGGIVAALLLTPNAEPTPATVESPLTTAVPETPTTTTTTSTPVPPPPAPPAPPAPPPPAPTVDYVPTTTVPFVAVPVPTFDPPAPPPPRPVRTLVPTTEVPVSTVVVTEEPVTTTRRPTRPQPTGDPRSPGCDSSVC